MPGGRLQGSFLNMCQPMKLTDGSMPQLKIQSSDCVSSTATTRVRSKTSAPAAAASTSARRDGYAS